MEQYLVGSITDWSHKYSPDF